MKKRLLLMGFLICLVIPFIWAGGEGESASGEEKTATMVWYLPGGANYPYDPQAEKAVYEKASEMTKEAFNAELDVRVLGTFSDYNKKMPVIMASGEEFDLAWAANWSNDFYKAAHDGMFAPLQDLLPEYAPTAYENNLAAAPDLTVNGNLYGVTCQAVIAKGTRISARKDLIDRFGWEPQNVDDPKELEPMLSDVAENEPSMYTISTRKGIMFWLAGAMKYADVGVLNALLAVKYDDSEMKVVNRYDQEDFKQVLGYLRDWYQNGLIPADAVTMKEDQKKTLETNGKAGIILHNSYDPTIPLEVRGGHDYHNFLMGDSYIMPGIAVSTVQTIGYNSKNKEKAAQLLELIATDSDFYNLISFGIEGENYEKLEPNRIKFKPDGGYSQRSGWIYGLQWYGYLLEHDPPNRDEAWKEWNGSAYAPYILGFVADQDPVKTQIAGCSSVAQQYRMPIDVGAVGPDVLEKFNNELKKAGIDEIIAELQSQIDAWAESK